MYQVIEYAGKDRERIVAEFTDYVSAVRYCDERYGIERPTELEVDILKDGTTEF